MTNTAPKVRPMEEADLAQADRVLHVAFGTFLGFPDPEMCFAGRDYVTTRWRTDPTAAFVAEADGKVVGSNFAQRWGSVAFVGPLTVDPEWWDRGIGLRLMEPVMEKFRAWNVRHMGLVTPGSPKHMGLYQRFGFWPRFLTAIMTKPVTRPERSPAWKGFSELDASARQEALRACVDITEALYSGLDLRREIESVAAQGLGETVLLESGARLEGFAVCHLGAGSEAGPDTCFVKFAAVPSGANARAGFERLIDACESLAAQHGTGIMEAGVSTARHEPYAAMLARGFRGLMHGIAMHRPNEPAYSRPGVYVMDDWR